MINFNLVKELIGTITYLGVAFIGVWGLVKVVQEIYAHKLRMSKEVNANAQQLIDFIQKNDYKFDELRKELGELEDELNDKNGELYKHCENLRVHIQDFRKDTLDMIKIALKVK